MVAYAGRKHHLILPLRPQTEEASGVHDVVEASEEQFAAIDTLIFLAVPVLQVYGGADSSANSSAYVALSLLVDI